jgi:DNA-binding FadR family transcriptional regulator
MDHKLRKGTRSSTAGTVSAGLKHSSNKVEVSRSKNVPKGSRVSHQEIVRGYIERGNFSADGRIPPERELVTILGLTRNQIRSSFKRLEREGLIWRHVGKGTFVGPRPAEISAASALPDLTNPREVIEARLIIEPILARLAANRASPEEIELMEQVLERQKGASSPDEFQRYDREWHVLLARASGNRLIASFLDVTHEHTDPRVWSRMRNLYINSDRMLEARNEHKAVLDAVRARDPDKAAEMMRAHILEVRSYVMGDFP